MTEVPANPEALLAETAWLRRIAGELARDSSGADDLTQETMLAALRQPAPSHASMRTWLESIARRLNARFHRSTYHRDQRERKAARPEAVDSAAQMFDQFTLHRDVVQAVMGLNEPLRSTVLMRFWEGLPPRKIASRLDIPVETVRSRLKLGLTKLRRKLDRDYGRREAWAAPLLAIQIPHGVSITSISLGAMVMIMKKKAAFSLAAVALVLTTGGLWWSDMSGASTAEPLENVPSLPLAIELGADQTTVTASEKVARTELAVEPQWMDGTVVDESGAPVSDVEVFLIAESKVPGRGYSWGNLRPVKMTSLVAATLMHLSGNLSLGRTEVSKFPLRPEQSTRPDEQGAFRFRRTPSDEPRFVGLWSPERGCRYQPFVYEAASIEVLCAAWPHITGRVLTENGQPVAHQGIELRNGNDLIVRLETDEHGAYRSPGLPPSLTGEAFSERSYELTLFWPGPHEFEDRESHAFELTDNKVVDIILHPVPTFSVVLVDGHDQPWTEERLASLGWSLDRNMRTIEQTGRWPLFFSLSQGSKLDAQAVEVDLDFDPETGVLSGFQPDESYETLWIWQNHGGTYISRAFPTEGRKRIPVVLPKVVPAELSLQVEFPPGTDLGQEVDVAVGTLHAMGWLMKLSTISTIDELVELIIPGEARGMDVWLQITAAGYAEQLVPIPLPLEGNPLPRSILMRSATRDLRGSVLGEDGKPVQAELMVTNHNGSFFQDKMNSWLLSTKGGRFRLKQMIDERPVRVFVKHDDYADSSHEWNTARSDDLVIRLQRGEEYQVAGLKPGRYQFRVLDIAHKPLADDKVFGTTRPHDSILRLGPRAVLVEARRPGLKQLWGSAEVGEGELRFSRAPSKR